MDKQYLLSDGRTKIVPLGFEEEFLKQLEEQNLTAELITDEPGKSLGTSLSQNNQQLQVNKDMGIDLATGEVISKQQQEATESKSEDGSLESQLKNSKLELDAFGEVINNSNYESKLSELEKEINRIKNINYTSNDQIDKANQVLESLNKDYENIFIEYKNQYDEYEILRKDYNKLIDQGDKKGKQNINKISKPSGLNILKQWGLKAGETTVSMIDNFIKTYECL